MARQSFVASCRRGAGNAALTRGASNEGRAYFSIHMVPVGLLSGRISRGLMEIDGHQRCQSKCCLLQGGRPQSGHFAMQGKSQRPQVQKAQFIRGNAIVTNAPEEKMGKPRSAMRSACGTTANPTTLMCGRPSPCRPALFRSNQARMFPLTGAERNWLLAMYPSQWKSR
jgi:hypothetical protein